jgi:peptidoglycan/xylan/chitin deacetylase (PgdA/CDA1 family)
MFGTDDSITQYVNDLYINQTPCTKLEIASHGWNHEAFSTFNLSDQVTLMQNTQNKMLQMFGAAPTTFIPPFNQIDANTRTALRTVGFKVLSSEVDQDPPGANGYPINVPSGQFYQWPIRPATGVTDTPDQHYVPVPISKVYQDMQTQLRTYGFAAIMMHPYEFAFYDDATQDYLPTVNQTALSALKTLIEMVKADGIRVVTFDEVEQYFNASKIHPCTPTVTTGSITTAPMTTGEMTTAPMTTGEITSAEMTTSPITTGEITSAAMTSAPMRAVTTGFDVPVSSDGDEIRSSDASSLSAILMIVFALMLA